MEECLSDEDYSEISCQNYWQCMYNELISLGGQAAAAAHSLGTPLSTILLTVSELKKELGDNNKISKDLDLLVSQSNRCREILKKLTMNPKINDGFLESNLELYDYLNDPSARSQTGPEESNSRAANRPI